MDENYVKPEEVEETKEEDVEMGEAINLEELDKEEVQ